MGDNFDDQWEDLDEEVIKECIFIETQTLSQAPPTEISSSQSSNINFRNGRNNEKSRGSRESFPSLSSFYNDNPIAGPQNLKFQKTQPFLNPLNNKVYNAVPNKGGIVTSISNGGKQEGHLQAKFRHPNNAQIGKHLPQNHDENQLENLKKEKEKLLEENLIKQGEVYNLRCELKRKETVFENERVDHCLAVEAAEKRGKEKSINSLKDSELKVKILQVEIEKLYGSIAFKNREVEELLARCQQLEQHQHAVNATSNKKPVEISQSTKRFKRELKTSPSNFSDRFDFNGKKCELKDVQMQTDEGSNVVTRYSLPIFSKKGKMCTTKKALVLAHDGNQMNQAIINGNYTDFCLLEKEILSLQFRNNILLTSKGKFDSIGSLAAPCDDYLIKSLCIQLENILTIFKKSRDNEKFPSWVREKYNEVVLPVFNMLRISTSDKEDVLYDVIKTLARHFLFIFKELKSNISCLYSGLESMLLFSSHCTTLPLSVSELISQSLEHGLENLSSCNNGKVLLIKTFSSLIRIETFKYGICKNKAGGAKNPCLLTQISSIFSTSDNLSREDIMYHLLVLVSILLQPPNCWLKCSCSSTLLHILVRYLHYLTTLSFNAEGSTWHLILFGIKVLHKWQLLDANWWDKIAPMPNYTVLIGIVYRRCKILETTGKLNQYIRELLYDLHGADET